MVEIKGSEVTQENRIISIIGPTASGKTTRAVSIAKYIGAEIISGDSRQVYRGMDIGTGKDLEEYESIPYHLIDICDAGEKYNLHRFISDFRNILHQLKQEGKRIIVCGGTGMYIETALSGVILPEVPSNIKLREKLEKLSLEELTKILKNYKTLHNTTDVDTIKRAVRAIEIEEYYLKHPSEAEKADRKKAEPLQSLIIGIDIPREERRRRITERLYQRLEQGMVNEVEKLLSSGIPPENLIYYGLEYKYLTLYVTGVISYENMIHSLEIAIHQFAKRQMTWFRGMENRGFKINWLPYDLSETDFITAVDNLLRS